MCYSWLSNLSCIKRTSQLNKSLFHLLVFCRFLKFSKSWVNNIYKSRGFFRGGFFCAGCFFLFPMFSFGFCLFIGGGNSGWSYGSCGYFSSFFGFFLRGSRSIRGRTSVFTRRRFFSSFVLDFGM